MKGQWTEEGIKDIADEISKGTLDRTLIYNNLVQQLIVRLSREGKPFKLYNLGAGVKRITMDTDTCPCCKRKLKEVTDDYRKDA